MTSFESDWLASSPVFYNARTNKVSENINDVIDFNNLEFHPEGFNNYLDFGYSVFEQTPVKDIKFLRHSSRISVSDDGKMEVTYLDDPAEEWCGKVSNEEDVLEMIRTSVERWEDSVQGEIILPTSGGNDSRLLNLMIKDRSRIRSFTYGLSENQSESFEVAYARKISEILGTEWEQINLGNFHQHFIDWDDLYGPSTHAHGMYHFEFYRKIFSKVSGGNPLLCGIIGDAWAGSVKIPYISSSSKLKLLGYTHGMNADSSMSLLSSENDLENYFYERSKKKLKAPFWKTVEAMRMKVILLSYLVRVPICFGFSPWSPFLDRKIALSMLTLPEHRLKDRIWQKDFFAKNKLDLESMDVKVNLYNTLNHQALRREPPEPLNVKLLREVMKPSYVEWINQRLTAETVSQKATEWLLTTPLIGGLVHLAGLKDKKLIAYFAYLTLKPIENLIKKRNAA